MEIEKVHIGECIKEIAKNKFNNDSLFASKIGIRPQNLARQVYKKQSMDTALLSGICKILDYNNKMLKIPSFVAKNHNERVLALPDDIYDFLVKYKDLNGDLYIFSTGYNPGKQLIDTRASGRTWSVMRAALQLPMSYQFYSLKDTGITEMLEQGMPAKYVKELADHHSLEMTEKYTHKSSAKKILEYNKLKF